jgi:hypothetical protein
VLVMESTDLAEGFIFGAEAHHLQPNMGHRSRGFDGRGFTERSLSGRARNGQLIARIL